MKIKFPSKCLLGKHRLVPTDLAQFAIDKIIEDTQKTGLTVTADQIVAVTECIRCGHITFGIAPKEVAEWAKRSV